VTFLSSLILELVATVSVALVAVAIGLQLLGGDVALRSALIVLILAPEAYLPLRLLGANYHASIEGLAAAQQAFDVLALPLPTPTRTRVAEPSQVRRLALAEVTMQEVTISYPGRERPALDGVSLSIGPGEVVAIVGRSGCGKSTLLSAMLRILEPDRGSVRAGGVDLSTIDPDAWRANIAWMPQRPHLFSASIEANIRLGQRDATAERVWEAVQAAGLQAVVAARPDGLGAMLGDRGLGLAVGERQRVALARAFVRDAPIVLLDEPTANLDGETEEEILAALGRLVRGRTVVLVAHRPALLALADRVIELDQLAVAA
jgi:ABC-type transport system involved in cytochrome bd biosynthesis fused ATPase/permease subunit